MLSPAYPLIVLFVKLKLSVRNSLNVKLLPLFKLIEPTLADNVFVGPSNVKFPNDAEFVAITSPVIFVSPLTNNSLVGESVLIPNLLFVCPMNKVGVEVTAVLSKVKSLFLVRFAFNNGPDILPTFDTGILILF